VIAASNKDLRAMCQNGTFREDLYFRLNVITVNLPPLRERAGDAQMLAEHFMQQFERRYGRPGRAFDPRFLDEVGELPQEIQVKLLRVLQMGEVERLGSTQTVRVDVRLIAATNRNLEEAVAAGRFRSDLYYRLHVFPIHVPPLRERPEDIPLLVAYLAERKGKAVGKIIDCIPEAMMQRLLQYSWPGNVRELENVIERAIILSRDGTLSLEGVFGPGRADIRPEPIGGSASGAEDERRLTHREMERAHIVRVCEDCGWRIKGPDSASVRLGLKPSTLYYRIHKLGIARPS